MDVTQVDILEEFQLLIVLSGGFYSRDAHTIPELSTQSIP